MRASSPERRFRINPIEVVILLGVATGFGFSVYNVFRESEQFRFAALQPMKADPTRSVRMPASVRTRGRAPVEVPCAENPGFKSCSPVNGTAPIQKD